MLYARRPNSNVRITASPSSWAICPACDEIVVAKCGEINIWHWAHQAESDCDPWSEGETAWHLGWKRRANPDQCEVIIGRHRADIVGRKGIVIELQHSSLSPPEVREREAFYGDVIWIVDASEFHKNFIIRSRDGYYSFRWKYPRKWMWSINQILCLDFGHDELFLVCKICHDTPCGGWGRYLDIDEFIAKWFIRSELSGIGRWTS